MKINEIDWRPICECKQGEALPENCFAVYRSKTGDITSSDLEFDVTSHDVSFAIIRKPVVERVLKPCPFRCDSICESRILEWNDWRVVCPKCGCLGPRGESELQAEDRWGYE